MYRYVSRRRFFIMPRILCFIVDAFTTAADRPFSGNPAAVCPLEQWPEDALVQRIAAENNMPMTAFFAPKSGTAGFELRWFLADGSEERLCGHATLASAHVLVHHLGHREPMLTFETVSGTLAVHRRGERLELDFRPCLRSRWPRLRRR
jgi:PhzF family phenazine biosynthesis protein